ncbi:bacteriohemerythrin [Pelosinus sp. sgz500959]|uniref:bacteriohemerythrin n=1 Tax=Pelosinus sp. sgz500959 TaxID=3242472 RepID=UPI0036727003
MNFYNWDEKFSVGIRDFDEHHKELIDLLNEVYKKVFQCEDIDEERILTQKTLSNLLEYTKYHFTAEEALMKELDYPEYEEHKGKHDYYINEIDNIVQDHKKGGVALSFTVFMMLKEWIMVHILVEDKQYSQFFKENGIQ